MGDLGPLFFWFVRRRFRQKIAQIQSKVGTIQKKRGIVSATIVFNSKIGQRYFTQRPMIGSADIKESRFRCPVFKPQIGQYTWHHPIVPIGFHMVVDKRCIYHCTSKFLQITPKLIQNYSQIPTINLIK